MSRPAHAVSVRMVVPFHDCDPLFVSWHGRYFQYLEIARTALMKSLQLDVPDLIGLHHRMFVTDARCRYLFPLRYDETFTVTAWCAPLATTEPLIKVVYEVFNETKGRKAARGSTTLALTDDHGALLTELPPAVRSRLPD